MNLPLSDLITNAGTQSRAMIDERAIAEYAERMAAGDEFPPVDVFHDGVNYYLADGFHRVFAASRNKLTKINATVHKGSKLDAVWFSIGANRRNGLIRSPMDKRSCVVLALKECPEKTQREIAEQVGCVQSFVSAIQKELITSDKLAVPTARTGKDGKTYPTSYKKAAPVKVDTETEDEKPHVTCGLPVDQEVATNLDIPEREPEPPLPKQDGIEDFAMSCGIIQKEIALLNKCIIKGSVVRAMELFRPVRRQLLEFHINISKREVS